MSDMFYAAMPLVMLAYFFGIKMGRIGMSHEPTSPGDYAKHWYVCTDCTPGITYKIGADTKDHLRQVIEWHEHDHHGEEEECSDTTAGPNSLRHRLQLAQFTGWVGEMVEKRKYQLRLFLTIGFARIVFPLAELSSEMRIGHHWSERESVIS